MKKENSGNNIVYILIVSIIVTLLIALLIIVNVNGPLLKEKNKNTTTTTTTSKKVDEKIDTLEVVDSITIEGEEENFTASIYKSDLGFQLNYDKEFFTLKENNNVVIFTNIYNENNYVKIEKINKDEYLKDISENNSKNPCEENGYTYTYKYFERNNIYLRVTESLIKDAEYEGLNIRMDYMVNSLQIIG